MRRQPTFLYPKNDVYVLCHTCRFFLQITIQIMHFQPYFQRFLYHQRLFILRAPQKGVQMFLDKLFESDPMKEEGCQ